MVKLLKASLTTKNKRKSRRNHFYLRKITYNTLSIYVFIYTHIHTVCEGGGMVMPLKLIILPPIVTDYLTKHQ